MPEKQRLSYKQKKEIAHDGHKEYFEGVLQLRFAKQEQLDTIVDYIHANNIRISKHLEEKNGLDLYLTSQKFIQQLARWIPQRFKCQITVTRTLHTRDNKLNKDLYRVTLLVEFLSCKIGDIVDINGDLIKITSLGKKPVGKVLSTGKRVFIEAEKLTNINNEE